MVAARQQIGIGDALCVCAVTPQATASRSTRVARRIIDLVLDDDLLSR